MERNAGCECVGDDPLALPLPGSPAEAAHRLLDLLADLRNQVWVESLELFTVLAQGSHLRVHVRALLRLRGSPARLGGHPFQQVGARLAQDGGRQVAHADGRRVAHLEGEQSGDVIEFDPRLLGIPQESEAVRGVPIQYVLFPRPGFTLQRTRGRHAHDRYTHGGLSLSECMVPMVVMGPRRGDEPALAIESVEQISSVSEGEPLTLAITVAPTQAKLPDMAITLAFSREDIPARREVFRGKRATYSVRWTPQLGDISDEDRRQGAVVQPVTVILSYHHGQETVRLSRTADMRVKLDPTRLRRRVDSKLDLLMGKVPKGLQ